MPAPASAPKVVEPVTTRLVKVYGRRRLRVFDAVVRAGRKRKTMIQVFSGRDGSALPATLA
jgi:hypothetical protein